jgi:small-conductance mechanosensitive channel
MIMAISQLRIDTEMVRLVTSVLLAGAALAFGLSFGLGTRDLVKNLVAGFYARKVLEVGKVVEIAGQQGTLAAITATHIILEQPDKQSVSIANTMFLDQIAKQ